jgi:phage terminase small subunit
MRGLKAKQQLFVQEYLVDLNATQAAIRAGYSVNCASEIGYENLRKPHIAAAIDSALMELGGITRARIIDELGAIAFADIGTIVTWEEEITDYEPGTEFGLDGELMIAGNRGITRVIRSKVNVLPSTTIDPKVRRLISEVSQTDKGSIKIKLCDKLAALDKLARALGMYTDNLDVAGKCPQLTAVTIYEGRPASWPTRRKCAAEAADAAGDDGD